MSTTCRECGACRDCGACRECGADAEREHCHGTVILHIGQRPECTEADCATPEAVHSYFIDCSAVGCGCAEAQPIGPAVSTVSAFSPVAEAG